MKAEEYLNNFYKGSKNDLSLETMEYFMKEYNNFQKEMKFIHIAGTNGKGSCVEIISNILVKQGYKVGKFLSPHLIKYNERISINNKEISDEELSKLINEVEEKIKIYKNKTNRDVSLFELETIMGLLYFYRKNVDFVVLETGLGGLYDSTNIISNPLVSIISSIGFDHVHILGNTLSEIAYQKAGIIKPNSNTVFFKQTDEVNNVFISMCKQKNNKLHLIENESIKNYRYDENYQYFDYKDYKNLKVILKGKKQVQNSAVCVECIEILKELGYEITEKSIREGLATVVHRGRMEKLCKNPIIIFDGAHNEPAIQNLQTSTQMYYKNQKRRYIISILKRKDYDKMIKLLMEDENAEFIFTSGNDETRYALKEDLYEAGLKYRKNQKLYMMELNVAINKIINKKDEFVNFVIGSFYVYGDVLKILKNN